MEHVAWDPQKTADVYGPEGAKPVVLVHGALVGRQCMALEAKALAEAGYRVIVPDLPAHGARFAETPLTLDNAVDTLAAVIQQEAPGEKVVMMGFSMGGYVTAAFAARHPDLVCGVVLGGCCHDTHTFMWGLIGRLAELVYAVCSPKTKSQFIFKGDPVNMSPHRVEIQQCFTRAGAEMDSWRYVWRVMQDADMHKLLPQVTCPALLVVGEKDYRSHEKKWLSLLRKGELLMLKNGIHPFMFQAGVAEVWRAHAVAFPAAAHGLRCTPKPSAYAIPEEPEDAAVSTIVTDWASGAGKLQPEVESKKERGPGLGVLLSNLLAQFRKQQSPAAAQGSSAGTTDGGLLAGGGHSHAE